MISSRVTNTTGEREADQPGGGEDEPGLCSVLVLPVTGPVLFDKQQQQLERTAYFSVDTQPRPDPELSSHLHCLHPGAALK